MAWAKLWLNEDLKTDEKPAFGKLRLAASRTPITRNALAEIGRFCRLDAEGKPDLTLRTENREEDRESFTIRVTADEVTVTGNGDEGLLYGVYHLLRLCRTGGLREGLEVRETPAAALRMLDHWDNTDGSIERGYAGRSFFFRDHDIIVDERTEFYCRLLASVGVNAIVFNNVNVKDQATKLISPAYYEKLRKLFALFVSYGIEPFLSLNYASPIELGGLETADPLDERVIAWWEMKMDEVFAALPDLGGFLVKADSEGRPGPFTYGRTQADGANLLAHAAAPYGKIIIWRAFVYNCQQDWRDRVTDRARASTDYFLPLDGQFDDNVYLQVKYGPMDFQVREPVTPLFCRMRQTRLMPELQIAQEYTGQQIDLFYLPLLWEELFSFETERGDRPTLADLCREGIAAVANTGDDPNWCGHPLAAANLYGFGRLAWDPSLGASRVADEWLAQTTAASEAAKTSIKALLLASRSVYEGYTAPLGIGWMVTPHTHYGPSVDGYEYSRWGTYHRADHFGIGVDRTEKGTGYAGLYPPKRAALYENPDTCPDELLLFFHHVPYTHRLKSGKTVIQHIYDSRFEAAAEAEDFVKRWEALASELEPDFYEEGLRRFRRQAENAREWRDQVNSYFYRKSAIPDEKGRKIY